MMQEMSLEGSVGATGKGQAFQCCHGWDDATNPLGSWPFLSFSAHCPNP